MDETQNRRHGRGSQGGKKSGPIERVKSLRQVKKKPLTNALTVPQSEFVMVLELEPGAAETHR